MNILWRLSDLFHFRILNPRLFRCEAELFLSSFSSLELKETDLVSFNSSFIETHTHRHKHACAHAHTRTRTHTYTHTQTHMYIYTHRKTFVFYIFWSRRTYILRDFRLSSSLDQDVCMKHIKRSFLLRSAYLIVIDSQVVFNQSFNSSSLRKLITRITSDSRSNTLLLETCSLRFFFYCYIFS
jgi:hypothetical protein